jgi:hypothetical protein
LFVLAILAPSDGGTLTRAVRDAEGIERHCEPAAKRLHERFLSRPAIEEAAAPLLVGQGEPFSHFLGTEHALYDLIRACDLVQSLEIDPEILLRAKREQREAVRVGEIEMQPLVMRRRQVGLPAGP